MLGTFIARWFVSEARFGAFSSFVVVLWATGVSVTQKMRGIMLERSTYQPQWPRFQGKVALVTGSGQGIGQATAFRLALEGAAVGVMDRNEETAQSTAEAVEEMGGSSLVLVADVADPGAVTESVERLRSQFGDVDVLVNNAGFDRPGAFLKVGPDDFRAVWEVHLLGAVNCCQACARIMIEKGDGRIVNVSSIYGKTGSKGEAAYCSVKAGLIGLTKSLAREWGRKGIRVNAVLPGLTDTPTIRDVMLPKFKEAI
ncbi:MAG: SDR family oxidoreductase, partial [Deltaproteobacteria bacterium]|nr:SDR family oxidoreductase [Deltaproteobacteria bacterium]